MITQKKQIRQRNNKNNKYDAKRITQQYAQIEQHYFQCQHFLPSWNLQKTPYYISSDDPEI